MPLTVFMCNRQLTYVYNWKNSLVVSVVLLLSLQYEITLPNIYINFLFLSHFPVILILQARPEPASVIESNISWKSVIEFFNLS